MVYPCLYQILVVIVSMFLTTKLSHAGFTSLGFSALLGYLLYLNLSQFYDPIKTKCSASLTYVFVVLQKRSQVILSALLLFRSLKRPRAYPPVKILFLKVRRPETTLMVK